MDKAHFALGRAAGSRMSITHQPGGLSSGLIHRYLAASRGYRKPPRGWWQDLGSLR
jgi:hypothetical protein